MGRALRGTSRWLSRALNSSGERSCVVGHTPSALPLDRPAANSGVSYTSFSLVLALI